MSTTRLLATSALTVLALAAVPARAQEQAGTSPSSGAGSSPTSGAENGRTTPGAPTADTTDGADTIIVTAQGRAQALQEVPVAISAISAASLVNSGATDLRQIAQLSPSLLVSSTSNEANGSARIRGIGTVGDNPGLESSVAVFIDGVYRSRSGIGLNELGDIDRVEVLRGPQGTLFGRNASAGIISITSKGPSFGRISAGAEATFSNYNGLRLAGNVNVPLSDSIAARVDGVYFKRDGFLNDPANNTTVNDRNRYFVRGQLLFEPTTDLSIRLISDLTVRREKCCGAVYADTSIDPTNLNLLTTANPIIPVLTALGQSTAAFTDPYSRTISVTPGRSYDGLTKDYGGSMEINYKLGGAKLTSITAYREYYNQQGSDADYGTPDLFYRTPGPNAGTRGFNTFSQELRLQGEAFAGKLDWLVGGYFANEDLTTRENLSFGADYGRFAACRILVSGALAPYASAAGAGCLSAVGRAAVFPATFGAASPLILAGFDRLDSVRNVGDTGTRFRQTSSNYAAFTHNIFHVTDTVDLTIGLRYTHERKKLDGLFHNNNAACVAQQAALGSFLTNPALAAVAGGLIALTCQGNSSAALEGQTLATQKSENRLTGTAILSWKPTDGLLVYGSYARGYKAGGFNLDRSALKPVLSPFPTDLNTVAGNLAFDEELNTAFEAGFKFTRPGFTLNVAAFRQSFRNFQLNTFNGSVFIVQTINSCKTDLAGADTDLIAGNGTCSPDQVRDGVISRGVEAEATLSPAKDVHVGLGFTYADTYYRTNLIGSAAGVGLDPALRLLPGRNLSNAPRGTVTTSASWTPAIGSSGLSALFYADGRTTSAFNTGSDLLPQKRQQSVPVINARIGLRGKNQAWSIEGWVQNLTNEKYIQVGFNSPLQATTSNVPVTGAPATTFPAANYPAGTQIFSAFLAEPRTYGLTLRGKF